MKNAQNIAIEFHNALPYYDRPEYTENREGFYHLCSMEGDVTGAKLGYIVRDHSAESFAARKETMRHIAKLLNEKYGEGTVELELKDSYFSMLERSSRISIWWKMPAPPSARLAWSRWKRPFAAARTAQPCLTWACPARTLAPAALTTMARAKASR